ncbi:Spc98 family-domain-containing protein [Obelidium mucronatum]|nr:Spc98 family-domain-containing protein [Obelidium mucronatum]
MAGCRWQSWTWGWPKIFPHLLAFLSLVFTTSPTHQARLHGLAINNALYKMAHSTGVQELKDIWLLFLSAVNFVLGRQLVSWMVYGKLIDPHLEFFIGKREKDESVNRWNAEFELIDTMLPSYIPAAVGEDVLFVGKAVAAIRESKTRKESVVDSLISSSTAELSMLANHKEEFRPLELHIAIKRIKKLIEKVLWEVVVVEENLMDHLEIFRNYHLLGRGEFFVSFIDECDKLCLEAASRLSLVTEHDLAQLVSKVSQSFGLVSDGKTEELLQNIRFKKMEQSSNLYSGSLIGTPVRLEYSVKWPLDLIFKPQDLDKYNELMSFLIALKKSQIHLQRLWPFPLSSTTTNKSSEQHQVMTKIWAIRAAMMFFVDSLWGYVQMDVLASEYHKLQSVITLPAGGGESGGSSGGDFEAILKAHQEFLAACLRGLFLEDNGGATKEGGGVGGMKKLVGGTLKSCLGACEVFVGIVGRAHSGPSGWNDGKLLEDVLKVKEEFDQHSSFLFRILTGVQDTARKSNHLDALLLRLDHNLFYSMAS